MLQVVSSRKEGKGWATYKRVQNTSTTQCNLGSSNDRQEASDNHCYKRSYEMLINEKLNNHFEMTLNKSARIVNTIANTLFAIFM